MDTKGQSDMSENNDYVISPDVTVTMNGGKVRAIHCMMGNSPIEIRVDPNGYVDGDTFGDCWSVSIDDLPDQLDKIVDQLDKITDHIRKVNEFRRRYDKAVADVAGDIARAMRDADPDSEHDSGICESETWYCSFCRKEVPDDDMTECEGCGIDVCRDCVAQCLLCGDKVCPGCRGNHTEIVDGSVKGGDE